MNYDRNFKYGRIWEQVFKRDRVCLICNSNKDLTIDHIVGVKQGGKSTLANLRVLCRGCNVREGQAQRVLKDDPKNQKNRENMIKFRKTHPDYFRLKSKEFVLRNPGYYTSHAYEYRRLYVASKI